MLRSILRGVFVFLVGLSLVVWSDAAGEILIKALGIFLILSAVISIVYGLATNSYTDFKGVSLMSVMSALLFVIVGVFLLVKTQFFLNFIGFVLGIILALYGLLQLAVAVRNSKGIKERFWFFLIPAMIFAAGIAFCFFPDKNIKLLCILFGLCLMLLGASEIWMNFKIRALAKRLKATAQQEAEQMKRNQRNIVVEAIEPEESAPATNSDASSSAETSNGAASSLTDVEDDNDDIIRDYHQKGE